MSNSPHPLAGVHQPLWRRLFWTPSTRLGWWSIGLALGFFVFISLFVLQEFRPGRDRSTFFSDPVNAFTLLGAAACAITAGVTGALGIFWKRERSLLVFAALFLGALALFFTIGELGAAVTGSGM